MYDTDVEYKSLVQGMGCEISYGELMTKAGADFRESQPFLFVKSINKAQRQITALASTGSIDRDGEVIEPEAFRELLPVYMKNPVVITSHQHRLQSGSSSVVGNVINAWIDSLGLWIVIEFVKGTALGEEYWQLYSQKKQRAFSVGFMPVEHRYEERDGRQIRVYTKVELLEISCVAVPSNRDALSRSKQRKAEFVAAKKAQREEDKILSEIRANNPNFDQECEEFGDLLLGYDGLDEDGEVPDECSKDFDFAKAVGGKGKESSFAALVAGNNNRF